MEDTCLARLRVFLDASLLALLAVTGFALRWRVTHKVPPKIDVDELYDCLKPSFRRSTAVTVLGLATWGGLGLVLALERGCPASHWLVALCLALSGGCLLVGAWLGVREALLTVNCDILTLLWCLRCSCCSRLTKRALLLPPLMLLVTLNVATWLDSRDAPACNTSELLPPSAFFAGAASVFVAMVVATLAAVGCSLSHSWRTTSTRVGKILVTLGLAVVGFLSIGWAVVGLVSLPKHQYHVDTATLYDASCWNDIALVRAAHWSIAQLLAVGGLLLVTTLCCRLENFFLAPNAPKIDLTELSPTIAAMKTPERVEQSTRTEYVENRSESV